jgi:UDP-glucose 4,6-dehydratase
MNLLITGGCGFIGSNFINYYFSKYSDQRLTPAGVVKPLVIVNMDAMYYCASEENILPEIRSSKSYKFIKGNLQSKDLVSHILEEYSITHIIHFAAQSHVQNSFDDSLTYTMDNIVGTHTLLECCRNYQSLTNSLVKIIHVSTDEVYGESLEEDLKHESSVLVPTNPYAATKAGAELIAMSYIKSYKLPIVITRGNNVYGPNQYPEKLIPRFIEQLRSNQPVTIQGDGSALRSFLHVDDTCSAFETILHKGSIGEIYNIGTDIGKSEYSVMDVAKLLIHLIKGPFVAINDFIKFIKDRPFNDSRYFISNQKLKDLGWEIKIPFEEGIKMLI